MWLQNLPLFDGFITLAFMVTSRIYKESFQCAYHATKMAGANCSLASYDTTLTAIIKSYSPIADFSYCGGQCFVKLLFLIIETIRGRGLPLQLNALKVDQEKGSICLKCLLRCE